MNNIHQITKTVLIYKMTIDFQTSNSLLVI